VDENVGDNKMESFFSSGDAFESLWELKKVWFEIVTLL
jgi:hypothetical protein